MKRIALIDSDLLDGGTKHPNLVIMKLSGYYKNKGYDVTLIESYNYLQQDNYKRVSEFEKIFISKVFDFTKVDEKLLSFSNVEKGGTGFYFDHAPKLPEEIEHYKPDYHIYDDFIAHDTKHLKQKSYWNDYKYYSIGFATRGCFRQCPFCVNRNCKRVEFHSHIKEWVDEDRPYIYLWDDNILGYGHWKEVFEELKEINKPFQFRQGMDIRLMTEEKAKILNTVKYHGDIIFAFDHIEDKEIIEKKLQLWRKFCKKSTKLYVLSGYASQDEKEIESMFERIRILMKYQCLPYIMRHEYYLKSKYKGMFIQIARWCNQPAFFKKKSFREFCEFNQQFVKSECSSLRAMREFENDFPEIAKKYFDMKYDGTTGKTKEEYESENKDDFKLFDF